MVVLHAFVALIAGFATMAALVAVITVLLRKLTPSWVAPTAHPSVGYVFVNVGYSFFAAAAGGYVTAWLANANPLVHVLALAITVLLLSGLSALQQRGKQPVWYMLTLVALTPVGVLAGGLVRLRTLGIL
jgi:small-conductance mechanosensitive channel